MPGFTSLCSSADHSQNMTEFVQSDHLRKKLVATVIKSLDESVVRCEGTQCTAHVSVDNLQAVDVAGIDPAETVHGQSVSL